MKMFSFHDILIIPEEVDVLKIFLSLFVLFGVGLITLQGKIRWLFWLGVLLMFSRRINFPYLGDMEPSTVILFLTALLVLPKLLTFLMKDNLPQIIVLGLGLVGGAFINPPSDEFWTWPIAILAVYIMTALSQLYIKDERSLDRLSSYFIIISFIIGFTAVMAYAGFADNVIILSDTSPVNMDDGLVLYSKTYGIAYSNSVNGFIPLALIFLYSKKWNNLLRFIIFFSIVASVFISLKRIAYLSLIFSILYIIFRDGKPRLKPILLCCIMVVGGLVFFGKEITERFQNTGNALFGEESPDANRTVRIEYAWKRYLEHPVIGSGSGQVTYVHNGFLEILVNLGIPGLVILIPWLFKPIRLLIYRGDRRQRDWAICCLIYLTTLFLFEAVLNRLDLFWIFGLLFAGMESAQRIYQLKAMEINQTQWQKDSLALQ
jgi:hypothetical protein